MKRKWINRGHEFDLRGFLLTEKKKMVIYGNPYYSNLILQVCEWLSDYIDFEIILIDRDENLQKEGYKGYEVYNPSLLDNLNIEDCFFIISALNAEEEIRKILLGYGVSEVDIYTYKEFQNTYMSVYFLYKKDIVFFLTQNMVPNTFCNLNCKNCLNFNPYIKEALVDDFQSVKDDIDLFFEKVDFVYRFHVCGGEPFLNRDLGKILEYIYNNYRNRYKVLETITNGTIVPNDELCNIFKKCNVLVTVDDYRETVELADKNFSKVINKLEEKEINFEQNYTCKWICLYPKSDNCEKDNIERFQSFYEQCSSPWSTLYHKKITGCSYAHFAEKAGLIDIDNDSYFDLSATYSKKELLEFRLGYNTKGYMEFCKKCAGYYTNENYVKVAEQVENREKR